MASVSISFDSLPCAQACRRVDFDCVEVCAATRTAGRLLLVSGIKQWADLRVTLEPMIYREMPDFWVIEVVGRLVGRGLPAFVDFCAALPLEGLQGRSGIEIVGATKSERRILNTHLMTARSRSGVSKSSSPRGQSEGFPANQQRNTKLP